MREALFTIPLECLNCAHKFGNEIKYIRILTNFEECLIRGCFIISHHKRIARQEFPNFPLGGRFIKIESIKQLDEICTKRGIIIPRPYNDLISLLFRGRKGCYRASKVSNDTLLESRRISYSKMNYKSRKHLFSEESTNFKFFEGIFQAVRGAVVTAFHRTPGEINRWLSNRLPKLIFQDAQWVYAKAKEFANYCDRKLFDVSVELSNDSPFRVIDRYLKTDINYAQFRYMTRALPHSEKPSVKELIDRVSTPSDYSEVELQKFILWFRGRLQTPLKLDKNLSISISNSSCLERNRSSGGQSSLYQSLIKYQILHIKLINNDVDRWVMSEAQVYPQLESWKLTPEDQMRRFINSQTQYSPMFFEEIGDGWTFLKLFRAQTGLFKTRLLIGACLNLSRTLGKRVTRLCAMVVEERGGKWRMPFNSSLIIQVLCSILRSRMNHVLLQLPSAKDSLTGAMPKLVRPKGYLIRSQDLSFATDNHPFSMPRGLYQVLIDEGHFKDFPFAQEVLDLALPTNGREIVLKISEVLPLPDFQDFLSNRVVDPLWWSIFQARPGLYQRSGIESYQLPTIEKGDYSVYSTSVTEHKSRYLRFMHLFEEAYKTHLDCEYVSVGHAVKGPSMGEPLAWPSLPLVTEYCYTVSHKDFPKPFIITYGDDGQFRTNEERNFWFNDILRSLGSIISESKDVLHPNKGIFTEIISYNAQPIGALPLRMGYGLPGLKAKQTYFTVGPSVWDQVQRHNTKKWLYEKYMNNCLFSSEFRLAYEMGLDVNLPVVLGGLGLRCHRYRVIRTYRKLLSYLSVLRLPSEVKPLNMGFKSEGRSLMYIKEDMDKLINPYYFGVSNRGGWTYRDAVLSEASVDFILDSYSGTPPQILPDGRIPLKVYVSNIQEKLRESTYPRIERFNLNERYELITNPIINYQPPIGHRAPNFLGEIKDSLTSLRFHEDRVEVIELK